MPNSLALGDRMKLYESLVHPQQLMPLLPVVVRVDGRAFHTFTKGLRRPYDERLSDLMVRVTKELVYETGALMGYTQSDEISLLLYSDNLQSQIYFDGRTAKIISQTAALATRVFSQKLWDDFIPEKSSANILFDSRVFNVPTRGEAAAYFLWRERDATKNSITMAAGAYYSHDELNKKNSSVKQDMLHAKGINWNDFPDHFKRGTYVRRVKRAVPYSAEEIDRLPAQHAARSNPNLTVERNIIEIVDMPPFDKVVNKVGVLFSGEIPQCRATSQ